MLSKTIQPFFYFLAVMWFVDSVSLTGIMIFNALLEAVKLLLRFKVMRSPIINEIILGLHRNRRVALTTITDIMYVFVFD